MRPDLPFSCKSAVCGTCRAKATAGAVDMRRNFALEPAEVDASLVLTYQARPRSAAVTVLMAATIAAQLPDGGVETFRTVVLALCLTS